MADLLSVRKRAIHIVGGRLTRSLADYFFAHMQVIRDRVTLVASNSNTWPHYVLNMQSGDVLVIFDIRRYERDILRLAEMAKSKEVTLVLFTDQWGPPLARHAAHTFRSRIEAPPAWHSSDVTLFILAAMTTAVLTLSW